MQLPGWFLSFGLHPRLGAVLGVAVAVRLAVLVTYPLLFPAWELVPLAGDTYALAGTDGYMQLAHTLLQEGRWAYTPDGPAVHNRPPITSLLMVLAAAPFPDNWYWTWGLFQLGLHVLGIWVAWQLAKVLDFRGWSRGLWLWGLALHPFVLGTVRTSTFVTPAWLIVLAWAWAMVGVMQGRRWAAAVAGLLAGLAALTHATLLLLLPLTALGVYVLSRHWRPVLAALAVGLLTLAPWTLRNALTFGQFMPVASGVGIQYWKGEAFFSHRPGLEDSIYTRATGRPLVLAYFGTQTPEEDHIFREAALRDVQARPLAFVWRTVQAAAFFWVPWETRPLKPLLALLLNVPLVVALAWGALRRRRGPHHRLATVLVLPVPGLWGAIAVLAAATSYFLMILPLAGLVALLYWAPSRPASASISS
jgi:hypothetical protein